jgi:hypothetical protein
MSDKIDVIEQMLQAYYPKVHAATPNVPWHEEATTGMRAAYAVAAAHEGKRWEEAARAAWMEWTQTGPVWSVDNFIENVRARLSQPKERVTVVRVDHKRASVLLDGGCQITLSFIDAERYASGLRAEIGERP